MPDKDAQRPEADPSDDKTGPTPDVGKDDTPAKEVGGRDGPEPTRYGDWEVNGICTDF